MSATAFTGKRAGWRRRQLPARFLPPRHDECLLQHFDFQRLAAEQPFEVTDACLEFTHTAGADDVLIGSDGCPPTLGHQLPPLELQARGDAVQAGDRRDGHVWLHRLLYQLQLLLGTSRRRSRPVMISILEGSFGIGAYLGASLGPHGCAWCPVELGAAPRRNVRVATFAPYDKAWNGASTPRVPVQACEGYYVANGERGDAKGRHEQVIVKGS